MEYIPIIIGQATPQKQYLSFQTNGIPIFSKLFYIIRIKMLIIDDCAMSSDFLKLLKDTLIKTGFKEENIITVCIATTEVAIRSEAAPGFLGVEKSNLTTFSFFSALKGKLV